MESMSASHNKHHGALRANGGKVSMPGGVVLPARARADFRFPQTVCKRLILRREVVELADTPSMLVGLLLLYKLLVTSILPFTSITSIEPPNSGQKASIGAGYGKSVQNPVQ
jgi:hypothetical protein